jgi:hypothetical protein
MTMTEQNNVDSDPRFDRYQEADVSSYGKTGTSPYDHLFPDF